MANYRQIHVPIWRDSWFSELLPDEKLLFIYLFSNESSSLSGIYRINKRFISFETGIDQKRISEILDKFEKDQKVFFDGEIVWVKNLRKFHETRSGKVQTRIMSDIASIPDCQIKNKYIAYFSKNIPYIYPMHTQTEEEEEEKEEEKEEESNSNLPAEPFRILFDAFIKYSGIPETMMYGKTLDPIREWIKWGVKEKDIEKAINDLREKNYQIVRPASINTALQIVITDNLREDKKNKDRTADLSEWSPA